MNVSSTSYSADMLQQMQQMQRKEPPSAAQLSSKVMETSDLNGDSLLSIEELGLSEESFSSLDTDGDGSLSSDELQNSISSKLDGMKNQEITPKEFGSFLSELGLEVPPPPSQGGALNASLIASDIFAANDSDEDGTLSLEELGISDELFTSLDSDADGSITQEELAQGLTTLFASVESGEMSKDEAGEVLSELGAPPPPPKGGGGAGGAGGSSESYEAADANQDGTVTAAEQAAYDLSQSSSSDDMSEYTMNLVSTLLDALKIESTQNEDNASLDLSKFKSIMSMVNNEIQNTDTADKLNTYVSNLDINLKTA